MNKVEVGENGIQSLTLTPPTKSEKDLICGVSIELDNGVIINDVDYVVKGQKDFTKNHGILKFPGKTVNKEFVPFVKLPKAMQNTIMDEIDVQLMESDLTPESEAKKKVPNFLSAVKNIATDEQIKERVSQIVVDALGSSKVKK